MERGLAAGIVGGTVAAATGGNFENGTMTSAAAEIFNAQDENGESVIGKMWNSLTSDATISELEHDANAFGLEGGLAVKGAEEAVEGVTRLARVVEADFINTTHLGPPSASDVFVTSANDI